jgi:GAF domain-containing protein
LTVALHKDESLLGALTIYRYEVKPFTDRQIALLQNFAAQAVIAMENARLLTETREALEQQTATAEVLQVINSSPGDLRPVFEAMLGKAMHLCEANFGFLSTYDGERFDAVALHGLPQTYVREYLTGPYLPGPGTTHDRLVRGELVVHVPNLAIDQADSLRRRAVVDVLGVRSILAVPLRKDGMLVGAIHVFRQEVRPFTDKQIALLQNFAAQAVVAMDNARLLTETREALEQQTATAEVLGVINASPGDLAPVFDAILEKAHTLCGADHGSLTLAEGESFRAVAMRGMREEFAEELRRPFHPGWLVERLSSGEQFVQVADLAATTASPDNPVHRAAVEAGGVRTLLAVPLRKEQKLLGYITANRREVRSFTDKQIALLQNFAAQAVIAMENARLLTETREALEQQTATAEVLGVINASPGDLAPVFDAILEKAHTLCEADYGALLTYDGERFRPVAGSGASARFSELMHDGIRPSSRNSFGQLMRGERFVHIRDMVEIAQELDDPVPRSLAETGEIRTQLMVPLRKDGTVLGVITANRRVVRPFTDRQIALLENFAAQAVIAMENARLLGELRERNDEIAGWNKELEDRVAAQLGELERVGKLKRFLAPQLAELIVARGDEAVLETHRRDIVVVFCDLRDFTAFAETAEPEEVLDLLREYHGSLGPIVSASEGTLDHFSGDGIMVFFNDPVPVADASERAVKMAIEMREAMAGLQAQWRRQGRRIGFGAGIARGYATLGQIGFADRVDYTAIGTVCNLAARLCAEAKDGQILVSQRVAAAVEDAMALEEIGELSLKGLREPGAVYNVPLAGGQAALRVIEGGAPTL